MSTENEVSTSLHSLQKWWRILISALGCLKVDLLRELPPYLVWSCKSENPEFACPLILLLGHEFEQTPGDTEWASLVVQMVKNLPAMQETWVPSLGQEDPLEKKMATHSSILAWEIPWTEKPGGLESTGSQRVGHDWANKHQEIVEIRGAWQATVYWDTELDMT